MKNDTDESVKIANLADIQAEESLLSACIGKRGKILEVRNLVQADDFYRQQHRLIYSAMLSLAADGVEVDVVSLMDRLRKDGNLEKVTVGLVTKINGIDALPSLAEQYAGIVVDYSKRRNLVDLGREISQKAADVSEELDIQTFQSRLSGVHFGGADDGLSDSSDAAMDFMSWQDEEYARDGDCGIMTGFVELDDYTNGFRDGDLVILAARPSMGKTAFAVNVFMEAAKNGLCPVFYSHEMTKKQIMARITAMESGVDSRALLQPKSMTNADWDARTKALSAISQRKFLLTDKRGMTLADICTSARREKAKNDIGLIIIDHLQLLTSGRRREENRTNELDYISFGLKNLAGELGVPVIVLSQLSRAVESRNDKRPLLSDLRDSGAIEQNADIVLMMYREAYYSQQAENIAEIAVKKNRNGGTGTVSLKFIPELSLFETIDFGGQYIKEVPE